MIGSYLSNYTSGHSDARKMQEMYNNPSQYTYDQFSQQLDKAKYKPDPRDYSESYGTLYRFGSDERDAEQKYNADYGKYLGIRNSLLLDFKGRAAAASTSASASAPVNNSSSLNPSAAFDQRLETIKADNDAQVSKLMEQIKAQQEQYDNSMSKFNSQIDSLNSTITSYQNSYNPTTSVGTTARATSFEVPESTAGQLGIKNKGTSQFNRKVRNNLKITGVQL